MGCQDWRRSTTFVQLSKPNGQGLGIRSSLPGDGTPRACANARFKPLQSPAARRRNSVSRDGLALT